MTLRLYADTKDHRPDLKQILFGLSTVRGVPLYGNVSNGSKDDHTWNLDTTAKLAVLASEDVHGQAIYIADAAAVTKDNLAQVHETKTHFISRLPATYSLCEQLKRAAWEKDSAWCDLGLMSESTTQPPTKSRFRRDLYGQTYRFIAVRSTNLARLSIFQLFFQWFSVLLNLQTLDTPSVYRWFSQM